MRSHVTPPAPCTNCGKSLDRAMNAQRSRARPKPGAISICLTCRHVMVYAEDMSLRDPTDDEVVDIAGDPDLLRAMRLLGQLKDRKP